MSERLLEYLTGSAKLFSKINFVLKNDTDEFDSIVASTSATYNSWSCNMCDSGRFLETIIELQSEESKVIRKLSVIVV